MTTLVKPEPDAARLTPSSTYFDGSAWRVAPPLILVGLALSIGWGIRGNYGHEFGAMIPGVLASLAALLVSGRSDWLSQGVFFAFFGALGWSLGGSISYMQVIGYTHSGESGSVLYGFACLFTIGFLWAALGGAGAALPACLNRDRLAEFLPPLSAVFIGWVLQDFAVSIWFPEDASYRHNHPLYWYDTDWLAALVAIAAVGMLAAIRRRWDSASSLLLHLAVGWWVGFLLLVNLFGWRMTPPRGDNWAGCLGMVGGLWLYLYRHRLGLVAEASLLCGLVGGFGFAGGNLLKLLGIATGAQTNWHSVLEQTYGFINGIGLATALLWVARRAPPLAEDAPRRRWTEIYALAFVLLGVTYVNLRKNPGHWVEAKAMPQVLLGWSAETWFLAAYLSLAAAFSLLLALHRRRPLPLISGGWLVCAQWLFLIFLWWMVLGNFSRALPAFAPERLVTEGVIFLNAVLCTVLLLGVSPPPPAMPVAPKRGFRRILAVGCLISLATILAEWGIVRGIYGDRQAGYSARHIRFGPDATATKAKPIPGQPHP
jgi:hypothetical protein